MTTAKVTLTKSETQAIQSISQSKGKTQEEILHDAVEQFLARHTAENRLANLRQARGLWRERRDSPDYAKLRDEWNRL